MSAYISPVAYAKRLGVEPEKIRTWIVRGELRAINTALNPTGRPRYKISECDIVAFEQRRLGATPPKPPRRRRQPEDVIQFFT